MPVIQSSTVKKVFFPVLVQYYDKDLLNDMRRWARLIQQVEKSTDLETIIAHILGGSLWKTSMQWEWYAVAQGNVPGIYISTYVVFCLLLDNSANLAMKGGFQQANQ